jgi:thiol-disulfide isomerase/thioredoxin
MKLLLAGIVFLVPAIATLTAQAASIGDPAPPLTVERWVKGSPFKIAPGTNIFVVEFWATWCPPCRRSIPHLTELQKKYAGQGVIFLGVSDQPLTDVVPFVAGQGDNMAYRVGVDTSKRTFRAWMAAYGENGIPHAFIVNTNGMVVWHDFPTEDLDSALETLISGKFDLEYERNRETGGRLVKGYTALVKKPDAVAQAAPTGNKILSDYSRDCVIPYDLAKAILTDPAVRSRDLDLALRATSKAMELTKQRDNYWISAMHARALFANGKKEEAVSMQKKALDLCDDPEDRPELQKFLALYEKSAQEDGPKTK